MWNVMANRERKEVNLDITYVKPTAQHWLRFAKEVTENEVFNFWIDKAVSQALWQFIATIPVMEITGSTAQARGNSVLTLVFINATRMIFDKLLENCDNGLFSTNFTTMLATCKTDELMAEMVKNEFGNFCPDPTPDEKQLPEFGRSQPVVQKVLDYLKSKNMKFQKAAITEVYTKV